MTFSGGFEEAWGKEEPRESKMVFIGKNLDAKALAARLHDGDGYSGDGDGYYVRTKAGLKLGPMLEFQFNALRDSEDASEIASAWRSGPLAPLASPVSLLSVPDHCGDVQMSALNATSHCAAVTLWPSQSVRSAQSAAPQRHL